jgi:anthranilate phosphoribosyltransferase
MPNDVLSAALAELTAGRDLTQEDARAVLLEIMGGRTGEAQTAAFLSALRVKGETAAEIVGMARAMSELAEKVDVDADVILGTFNIPTAAARAAVASGSARATLDALVATTRRLSQESA